MSVKVCPQCGAEYLASVTECADDGSELLVSDAPEMEAEVAEEAAEAEDRDQAGLDSDELGDEPSGEQVAYELEDWSAASRVHLDHLLTGESVAHAWEAGTLVVRAEDEERVDRLVEQVEVTEQPDLDPDKEQVLYELDGWPEAKRDALAETLVEAVVPFGFDEAGNLVVHEEDEEKIEPIIDQVDYNFSLDGDAIASEIDTDGDDGDDEVDGLAVQDTLSDLFIAADRLMHDAKDREGILGMVRAAEVVAGTRIPYGFAPGVWGDIKARSAGLREIIEDTDGEDEAIQESARDLREVLRQFV